MRLAVNCYHFGKCQKKRSEDKKKNITPDSINNVLCFDGIFQHQFTSPSFLWTVLWRLRFLENPLLLLAMSEKRVARLKYMATHSNRKSFFSHSSFDLITYFGWINFDQFRMGKRRKKRIVFEIGDRFPGDLVLKWIPKWLRPKATHLWD